MMELVRVICLIPSMTETLIECGVNVVGRTRYCIHPQHLVDQIPILGGTKKINSSQLVAQKPDLIILDKEENTLETAEVLNALGCRIHVMHVRSLGDLAQQLLELSILLNEAKLKDFSIRLTNLIQSSKKDHRKEFLTLAQVGGKHLTDIFEHSLPRQLNYVIWKKPWMLIGKDTYIYDVLQFAGFELAHHRREKYPQTEILDDQIFHLFSSEPFPFEREWNELKKLYPRSLLVDGEKISWFGIRSLRFLEELVDKDRN